MFLFKCNLNKLHNYPILLLTCVDANAHSLAPNSIEDPDQNPENSGCWFGLFACSGLRLFFFFPTVSFIWFSWFHIRTIFLSTKSFAKVGPFWLVRQFVCFDGYSLPLRIACLCRSHKCIFIRGKMPIIISTLLNTMEPFLLFVEMINPFKENQIHMHWSTGALEINVFCPMRRAGLYILLFRDPAVQMVCMMYYLRLYSWKWHKLLLHVTVILFQSKCKNL